MLEAVSISSRRRGFVVCRIQLTPEQVVENTNQFEPGFEVFRELSIKDLVELWHPLAVIHLVEFDEEADLPVTIVEKFRVISVLGPFEKPEIENAT